MSGEVSIRREERERELVEIARLAREAAEQHTTVVHPARRGRVRARRIRWARLVALGTSSGVLTGLLVAQAVTP